MKAISLWQPYASLIPLGLKRYETRKKRSHYLGDLLICSALKASRMQADHLVFMARKHRNYIDPYLGWCDLPFGKAIAVVTVTNCDLMTEEFIAEQSEIEIDCGDWQLGRWAWKLENIRKIKEPFSVLGKQGFFNVDVEVQTKDLELVHV